MFDVMDSYTFDITNYAIKKLDWSFYNTLAQTDYSTEYKDEIEEQLNESELKSWINLNCKHKVEIVPDISYDHRIMDHIFKRIYLKFVDKKDFLLFKLTWCGEI